MPRKLTAELRFEVPIPWHEQLRAIAEENGQTMAAICRMAIRAFLPKREPVG